MKISINPAFDEFYSVKQDEVCVSDIDLELRTAGLSTCSALVIVGGGKHLLAHIDAKSNTHDLRTAISRNFELLNPDLKIYIIPGDGGFGVGPELSLDKITTTLEGLGINKQAITTPIYTDFMKDLALRNGMPSIEAKRIRQSEIIQQDGLQYAFVTNALPEHIQDIENGSLRARFGSGAYATERVYNRAVIGTAQGGHNNLIGVYEAR